MYLGTIKYMNRKEIAKIANVSTATISRFFNQPHLLSREIRDVIEQITLQYNYQPNALATQLGKKSKGKVALVFYPNDSLFDYQRFQAVYYLLLSELNKLPLSLILFTDPAIVVNHEQFDKVLFFGNSLNQFFNPKTDLIIFPEKDSLANENYINVAPY
jgi:DNA-binding LacI/PurR family transcriptional regulator